jgi:acyl-CoA thioester hydrolase
VNGFRVVIEVPIAWGDMDAFGHVNNTVFFRLFESARMAYLHEIGFAGDKSVQGPILHSTHCRFRKAITYPATVRVGTRVTALGEDRFTMEYQIMSGDGQIAAYGGGVVVAFDYAGNCKIAIPPDVRAAIQRIDNVGDVGDVEIDR